MGQKIDRLCSVAMIGIMSLVLFFLPFITSTTSSEYSEWPKTLFFLGGMLVVSLLWLVKMAAVRKLVIKKSLTNWLVAALVGLYFVSSLASDNRFTSFFGEINGMRLPFFVFLGLAVLFFSITQVVESTRACTLLLTAFIAGYGLALAQLLVVVTPLHNFFTSILPRPAMYSQVFDILMLVPTVVLLAATVFYSKSTNLALRIVSGLVFGVGALVLFIFGGSIATGITIFGLGILSVYGFVYGQDTAPNTLWAIVATIIILSVSFLVPTQAIFRVVIPAEITLDLPASYSIYSSTITESTKTWLFGSGPNTFRYSFSKFRPVSFNYTSWWQSRFAASGSALLEFAGAIGVLGMIVFDVLFILLFIRIGKQWRRDVAGQLEKVTVVGLAVTFLAATFAFLISGSGLVVWGAWWFVFSGIVVFLEVNDVTNLKTYYFATSHRRAGMVGFLGLLIVGILGLLALTFYRMDLADQLLVAAAGPTSTTQTLALTRALNLNPERVEIYIAHAQLELLISKEKSSGQTEAEGYQHLLAAIQIAERATAEVPNDVRSWEQLAAVFLATAPSTNEALLQVAKRAAFLEPTNPVWHVLIGDTESALGNTDEAIVAYQKAMALKNDWNVPYVKIATLLGRLGKTDEALAVLNAGLPISLTDSDYLYLFGVTYFNRNKTGDAEAAVKVFKAALEIQPGDKQTLFALAAAYERLKNYSEALAIYQRLLALSPSDVNVLKQLARVRGKVRGGR